MTGSRALTRPGIFYAVFAACNTDLPAAQRLAEMVQTRYNIETIPNEALLCMTMSILRRWANSADRLFDALSERYLASHCQRLPHGLTDVRDGLKPFIGACYLPCGN